MKIRNGFVSNSSSSSFVVGIPPRKAEPCPHCGRGGGDFEKLLESHDYNDTRLEWTDVDEKIEELRSLVVHDISCGYNVKHLKVIINKLIEAKKEFPQIIGFDVSYHDKFLNNMIKEMAVSGDIVIIEGGRIN